MRDIEKIIQEVNGTMAIEGMPLTEADKARLHAVLSDEANVETVVKQLVDKQSRKAIYL